MHLFFDQIIRLSKMKKNNNETLRRMTFDYARIPSMRPHFDNQSLLAAPHRIINDNYQPPNSWSFHQNGDQSVSQSFRQMGNESTHPSFHASQNQPTLQLLHQMNDSLTINYLPSEDLSVTQSHDQIDHESSQDFQICPKLIEEGFRPVNNAHAGNSNVVHKTLKSSPRKLHVKDLVQNRSAINKHEDIVFFLFPS